MRVAWHEVPGTALKEAIRPGGQDDWVAAAAEPVTELSDAIIIFVDRPTDMVTPSLRDQEYKPNLVSAHGLRPLGFHSGTNPFEK